MGTKILIHLVFLLCCCLHSVQLLGVEVTCPSEFRDGESGNIVSCRINRTAVRSCSGVQPYVTFQQTIDSHESLKCYEPSFNSSNCNQVKPAKKECWCHDIYGEVFEYKYAFFANQSRDLGSKLECKICHEPTNGLDIRISESCKNIKFGRPDSDKGLTGINIGIIIGIIVAIVFLVVIGIIVVIILLRRSQKFSVCHKSEHKHNTTQAPVMQSELVHMNTTQSNEE